MHRISLVRFAAALLLAAFATTVVEAGVLARSTLGKTTTNHALTRGHNRKVVYEPVRGHWYVFWVERDKTVAGFDGEMVYAVSRNGESWSKPRPAGFDGSGGSSFDVLASEGALYALGDIDRADGTLTKSAIRRYDIGKNGHLVPGAPVVLYDADANPTRIHYYGSLLRDSQGYFWVATRTHIGSSAFAEVIRSTDPGLIDRWGAEACTSGNCNGAWERPFPGVSFENGTVAPRLLDLGAEGVAIIAYNKQNFAPWTVGQLVFTLNPTRGHGDWGAPVLMLTRDANQANGPNTLDATRGDDRRFSAVVDPETGIIHVAYVGRDQENGASGTLRAFTLSPPYGSLSDKSPEQVVVDAEVDGVQLAADLRGPATVMRMFYVSGRWPKMRIRTLSKAGPAWPAPAQSKAVTGSARTVRYPNVPEQITRRKIVLALQQEKPGVTDLIQVPAKIRAIKLRLPPAGN